MTTNDFNPGDRVGARRWPYAYAHADGWGTPHVGTVLALNDPQAWTGTIAFGDRTPGLTETTEHVRRALARDPKAFANRTPVAWDFGKVHWEPTSALLSPEMDRALWIEARAARRAS